MRVRLDSSGIFAAIAVPGVCECVDAAEMRAAPCQAPGDLPILGAADGGGADILVTEDRDLLDLGSFEGIPIMRPGEAFRKPGPPVAQLSLSCRDPLPNGFVALHVGEPIEIPIERGHFPVCSCAHRGQPCVGEIHGRALEAEQRIDEP